MHAFYSALAIIENQQPRTRREAIRQEEKFYADIAEASRLWRFFKAIAKTIRSKGRDLEKKRGESSQSTGCNHGQTQSYLRGLTGNSSKGNSAGTAVCGSVHTRFS